MGRRNKRSKREKKPMAKAQRLSIGATDVRRDRGDVITQDMPVINASGLVVGMVKVDRVQDYLGRYAGQGHISPLQRAAGEKFADDCAGAEVGVSSQLGMRPGGGEPEVAILKSGFAAAGCQRRKDAAIVALGLLASVALWVCRDGKSAQAWALSQQKPAGDGIAALRLALDTLVLHYGLTSAARTCM
jgi:hypothetical protein